MILNLDIVLLDWHVDVTIREDEQEPIAFYEMESTPPTKKESAQAHREKAREDGKSM